jgi:hypothetical protein
MARSFNGTSDKVDCGAPPINSRIDFTFSIWALGNTWNGATKLFMANGQIGAGSFQWIGWNGSKFTTTMDGSGVFSTATAGASTGVWYHLAATLDQASQDELLYVNGVAQGTPQTTLFVLNGNLGSNDNFKLGCGVNSNVFLDGSLADAAVWNAKLTAGEIASLANGARPHKIRPASLIRFWDVGLNSPEPDLSGNVKNGTVTGTSIVAGPPINMFTPRWPQFMPAAAAATLPPPVTNLLFV